MCPAWKKKKERERERERKRESFAEKWNHSWPSWKCEHFNSVKKKKKTTMVKVTTSQRTR